MKQNNSYNNVKLRFFTDTDEYIINEKKKTICCKVNSQLIGRDMYFPWVVFTTRGIAKCKGDDVFDIEKGKKIARTKAQNKAYMHAQKMVTNFIKDFSKKLGSYEDFLNKLDKYIVHNVDYINRIS